MVRYMVAALVLKAFSINRSTKGLYRHLGNRFGGPLRRRKSYLESHVSRGGLLLQLTRQHGVQQGGERLLEIGTGWVHWHSVYQRLFVDARVTMFDTWDCRQLHAFKVLFSDLRQPTRSAWR